jgi:hypothetical protein
MPSEVYVDITDTDQSTDEIIIGQTPLNPHSTTHCWSCFIPFKNDDDSDNYYTQHEHPTLNIVVCSVCHDGGEFVERRLLDSKDKTEDDTEVYCSFCSLPSSSLDPPHPPLADGRPNDLLLCDSCPRAFCQKCTCVLRGGDLEYVRNCAEEEAEWKCGVCEPTDFLIKLKEGYASLLSEDDNGASDDGEEEARIAQLIDELHSVEEKYSNAQSMLEYGPMELKRQEMESELAQENPTLSSEELMELVQGDLENYRNFWIRNAERLQETIGKLQTELDDGGVKVADLYKFWEEEEGKKEEGDMGWKYEADLALGEINCCNMLCLIK